MGWPKGKPRGPRKPPAVTTDDNTRSVTYGQTSIARAEGHLADVERRIAACPLDPTLVKERRIAIMTLARLRGDAARINVRTLLRHPEWKRIASAVAQALVPYPDAAKAVQSALDALDGS